MSKFKEFIDKIYCWITHDCDPILAPYTFIVGDYNREFTFYIPHLKKDKNGWYENLSAKCRKVNKETLYHIKHYHGRRILVGQLANNSFLTRFFKENKVKQKNIPHLIDCARGSLLGWTTSTSRIRPRLDEKEEILLIVLDSIVKDAENYDTLS